MLACAKEEKKIYESKMMLQVEVKVDIGDPLEAKTLCKEHLAGED
jgi:hypothetical protein